MTIITCTVNQSGTNTPVTGYIAVLANNYLTSNTVFYAAGEVKYPLVGGTVSFDLLPTDLAKVSYSFSVVAVQPVSLVETVLYRFDAVVPFSATPINMVTLAPQSGLRYDRRDASLLTLARFLSSNDSFINFLGAKLWANQGTWNGSTVYKRGDVVLRSGSSYQYVASLQAAGIRPETDSDSWKLLAQAGSSTTPIIGMMFFYPSTSTVPPLYLKCNGQAVSRNTYPLLFGVIGTAFGVGDGTSTYNLPSGSATGGISYIIYAGT